MEARILLAGYTGAGKTSLIQAIAGKTVVAADKIGHAEPATRGFCCYRAGHEFEFWDSEGSEAGKAEDVYRDKFESFVRTRQLGEDKDKQIDLLWYCLDGSRARVTEMDLRLIRDLFPKTVVVITKTDIIKKEQKEAMQAELSRAGVDACDVIFTSSETDAGIARLLSQTEKLLPAAKREAGSKWLKARIEHYERQADKLADEAINGGAGTAALIAIIPVPFADMPMLIANQAYMIIKIGKAYGISVSGAMIATFLGTVGASIAGMTLAELFPVGKIFIAGAITYGVGKSAKAWFKSNMTAREKELKKVYASSKSSYKK